MIDKLQKIVCLRKENTLAAYMRFCHQNLGFSGWSEFDKKGVLDRWVSLLEQRLTKPAPDAPKHGAKVVKSKTKKVAKPARG